MKRPPRAFVLLFAVACSRPDQRPAAPGTAALAVPGLDVAVLRPGEALRLADRWYDALGVPITTPSPAFASTDSGVATVDPTGLVVARRPGEADVRATWEGAVASTSVRVVTDGPPGDVVDVFPASRHQVIRGWEASGQLGEVDCRPEAFRAFHRELVDRVVNELGLTRLRMTARSGMESPVDQWPRFRSGAISYPRWRATWMVATNDNDDPFVVDPRGFQWSFFDYVTDTVFQPIRRALEARGETLYVNLNYVDFWLGAGTKAFPAMRQPEEYAEFIRAVFDHLKARNGWVPDGVELNLEPENSPYSATEMGRALVAVERRLRDAGYTPDFIAPSTTRAVNAPRYYDEMMAVPGARGLIDEIAYHRYGGVSDATLRAILLRARRDGAATAMLEHIGSGFDGLYHDLTVANASAWEQFTLAYCGNRDNPENPGVYYHVNQADPAHPRIALTNEAKQLRQVFAYVRPGAVRLGAAASSDVVRPLAFRNANGRLVVVGWTRRPAAFVVRGLPAGTYAINYSTRAGPYNVDLPDVTITDGALLPVRIPDAGVITIHGRQEGRR